MQEWICNLGQYWGSAVGGIAIALSIVITVGTLVGIAMLIKWIYRKIADRWNDAELPTIQISYRTKDKIGMVIAVVWFISLASLVIGLFIYGGFNMWKNACEGLPLLG